MPSRPQQGKGLTQSQGKSISRGQASAPSTDHPASPAQIVSASYQFTGPIPSSQDLAHYEQVVPGLADRLIERFEKQSDYRMALEKQVIAADNRRANLGLIAGFLIAMTSIGASMDLILHGHDIAGTVLGGGTIVSLVSTFVYGTNSRRKERMEREKLLTGPQDAPDQEA